jgi:hypothetical protein
LRRRLAELVGDTVHLARAISRAPVVAERPTVASRRSRRLLPGGGGPAPTPAMRFTRSRTPQERPEA